MSKGKSFTKRRKGGLVMTSYDLIWRLVEMLLEDKTEKEQLKTKEQEDKD